MADGIDPATQKIAAVLADVDGTLVTKTKVLTPRAIRAVKELQEHGVLFAVTSGRPPRGMRMLVEPLGMKVPMAAFNGGIIILPDMTVVDERAIPADVAPAVIETIRAHSACTSGSTAGPSGTSRIPNAPHAEREATHRPVPAHRRAELRPATSTERSRSSASATTTTWSRAARRPSSSSSDRRSLPPGRSRTTST